LPLRLPPASDRTDVALSGICPGGTIVALPPPKYRQESPRFVMDALQPVSDHSVPDVGGEAGVTRPPLPQLVVPRLVVKRSLFGGAVVEVVEVVVLVVVVLVVGGVSSSPSTSFTKAFTADSSEFVCPVCVQGPWFAVSALEIALPNFDSAFGRQAGSTELPSPAALAQHFSLLDAFLPEALILAWRQAAGGGGGFPAPRAARME